MKQLQGGDGRIQKNHIFLSGNISATTWETTIRKHLQGAEIYNSLYLGTLWKNSIRSSGLCGWNWVKDQDSVGDAPVLSYQIAIPVQRKPNLHHRLKFGLLNWLKCICVSIKAISKLHPPVCPCPMPPPGTQIGSQPGSLRSRSGMAGLGTQGGSRSCWPGSAWWRLHSAPGCGYPSLLPRTETYNVMGHYL